MYAQNPMFSGVSPGRMAEARRFAQGGQMGRAKQQFELGGGQWNPQVHQGLRQQDNIGQMIPGPGGPGGPPPPPPGIGGGPGMIGGPGWGFGGGQGDPNRPVKAVMPEGWDQPGSPNYRPPQPSWEERLGGGMGGPPQWGAFPEIGGDMGGGMGRPPMPPPQFGGRPPAGNWGGQGGGFGQMGPPQYGGPPQPGMGGGFRGGMPAGPPIPSFRRKVMY